MLFDTDNTLYNYEPANRNTNAIASMDINKSEFLNYMDARNEIKNLPRSSKSCSCFIVKIIRKLGLKLIDDSS